MVVTLRMYDVHTFLASILVVEARSSLSTARLLLVMASGTVTCSPGANPLDAGNFVKRAAALRDKYRAQAVTGGDRRTLEPSVVVARPLNRNGVRMSGERCEELFYTGLP